MLQVTVFRLSVQFFFLTFSFRGLWILSPHSIAHGSPPPVDQGKEGAWRSLSALGPDVLKLHLLGTAGFLGCLSGEISG